MLTTIIGAIGLSAIALWIIVAAFRGLAKFIEEMNIYQWLMAGLMLACGVWYYKTVYEPEQEETARVVAEANERAARAQAQQEQEERARLQQATPPATAPRPTPTTRNFPTPQAPVKAVAEAAPLPAPAEDVTDTLNRMYGTGWQHQQVQRHAPPVATTTAPAYYADPQPAYHAPAPLPPLDMGREVHVNGYTRKDGTYVSPHTRSAPGHGRRH